MLHKLAHRIRLPRQPRVFCHVDQRLATCRGKCTCSWSKQGHVWQMHTVAIRPLVRSARIGACMLSMQLANLGIFLILSWIWVQTCMQIFANRHMWGFRRPSNRWLPEFQSKDAFFHCEISSCGAMVLRVFQLDFNRYEKAAVLPSKSHSLRSSSAMYMVLT